MENFQGITGSTSIQRDYLPELYNLVNLPTEQPKNPVTILESQVFNTLLEAKAWANQFYPRWMALDPALRGCAILRVIKDGANNGVYLVNPGETSAVYTGGTGISVDNQNRINFNIGTGLNVGADNKVNADVREIIPGKGIEIGASGEVQVKLSTTGNVDLGFDNNGAVKSDVYYRHTGSVSDVVANDVGGIYTGTAFADLVGPSGDKKELNKLFDKMLFTKRPMITSTEISDITNHSFVAKSTYVNGTKEVLEKGWYIDTTPNFIGVEPIIDTTTTPGEFRHEFTGLNPSVSEQDDIYYIKSYIESEDGIHFGEIKKVMMGYLFTGILESNFDYNNPAGVIPEITENPDWKYTASDHRKTNPVEVVGEPGIGTYGRLFVLVPKTIGVEVFCPNQPDFKFTHSETPGYNEIFDVTYDNISHKLYIINTPAQYDNNETGENKFQIYTK